MGQDFVDKADLRSQVVAVDVEGQEAAYVACVLVRLAEVQPQCKSLGEGGKYPGLL